MRLIDADELRNDIDNYEFAEYCDYSNMIDMIDDASTIEAEPVKHGKWVTEWEKRIYDNGDSWYAKSEVELRCSHCKAIAETFEWRKKDKNANIPSLEKLFYQSQWERLNSRKTKYCPNCGARMDGES